MATLAHSPITAPTGTALSCKGWHQEAALRMLMNNLDPAVAERPETDLDRAIRLVEEAKARRQSLSVGLVGNIAAVLPELVRRGIVPDVLTDQTSAHDALNGYVPNGMTLDEALALRRDNPAE